MHYNILFHEKFKYFIQNQKFNVHTFLFEENQQELQSM